MTSGWPSWPRVAPVDIVQATLRLATLSPVISDNVLLRVFA
jgi:hypothetical protein